MSTKMGIGNVRLYLFWSLLKKPRFFSITGNCKQKIWLKQLKAAPALDFPYFQHVSKLVTHDIPPEILTISGGFFALQQVAFSFKHHLPLFFPTGSGQHRPDDKVKSTGKFARQSNGQPSLWNSIFRWKSIQIFSCWIVRSARPSKVAKTMRIFSIALFVLCESRAAPTPLAPIPIPARLRSFGNPPRFEVPPGCFSIQVYR